RELDNKNFISNNFLRCYYCKKELFARLNNLAGKFKINYVLDASNFSDRKDFRPGSRAKKKLGIRSPLEEAGLNKEEIRKLSKNFKLNTWNKPALACLASRIPYGKRINSRLLKRIERSEAYLKNLGFKQVRVRDYQDFCRIEVFKKEIPRLLQKRKLITKYLKKSGYRYITVDLQGYRSGSLNPV
ncbi:MAG: ATP-dependent sacrificial sulfur transferase LarE, partial [Candidatus Omnitrophota bacterium]